jgi:hypothetical protein
MKRFATVAAGAVLLAMSAAGTANAVFTVGGENGWQLSTDGIVDVFYTYNSSSSNPSAPGTRSVSFLGLSPGQEQASQVTVGLLPSVVAFNIKAPTVNGIESNVRVGIYPSIQNSSGKAGVDSQNRFQTSPNIDFREFFYTAKGKYGELLAGRALNLYQGKSILSDMTLLTAGVVPVPRLGTTTTLGHIGYGYLYTNFGAQMRYTTPDFSGVKVAFAIGEPYNVSAQTGKNNMPRFETEVSYATTMGKGVTFQTYLSALYQGATRSDAATNRPGGYEKSLGGDMGATVGFSGFEIHTSGYAGHGLGMISAQDGALGAGLVGGTPTTGPSNSVDGNGCNRFQFGFLTQITYKLTPEWKLGINYGQNRQVESEYDKTQRPIYAHGYGVPMFKQEGAVFMVVYNLTSFLQFIGEYNYAQNTWADSATQHSNGFNIGTMFYW